VVSFTSTIRKVFNLRLKKARKFFEQSIGNFSVDPCVQCLQLIALDFFFKRIRQAFRVNKKFKDFITFSLTKTDEETVLKESLISIYRLRDCFVPAHLYIKIANVF